MRKQLVIGYWILVIGYSVSSCSSSDQPTAQQLSDHKNDVDAWFTKRIADLKSHDGWLNLAGLYWLHDGMNSFGGGEGNEIIYPEGKIADKAGFFLVKGQQVTMIPAPGLELEERVIFHPDSTRPINVSYKSLEWFVIKRDDKLGVRLRDLESKAVENFKTIDRYPVEYSWKVKATFEPAKDGETIDITNVLNQTTSEKLAGRFVFEIDGQEYKLAATGNGKSLFIVFGDATNGEETYPAGKFVYTDRPDSTGIAFIDFNKSYNPPCAFNDFATCPLPPKQNILPVAITAGEKNYDFHHN